MKMFTKVSRVTYGMSSITGTWHPPALYTETPSSPASLTATRGCAKEVFFHFSLLFIGG